MPINGKRYSWEDITINLPHGVLVDVDSIEYGDKKTVERVYGRGSNPVGYGTGNYEGQAKITLLLEEFKKLVDYAKNNGGSLYGLKPFSITVSYANEDEETITDELPSCKISEVSGSQKQGDTSIKREITLELLDPIKWGGVTANSDPKR